MNEDSITLPTVVEFLAITKPHSYLVKVVSGYVVPIPECHESNHAKFSTKPALNPKYPTESILKSTSFPQPMPLWNHRVFLQSWFSCDKGTSATMKD